MINAEVVALKWTWSRAVTRRSAPGWFWLEAWVLRFGFWFISVASWEVQSAILDWNLQQQKPIASQNSEYFKPFAFENDQCYISLCTAIRRGLEEIHALCHSFIGSALNSSEVGISLFQCLWHTDLQSKSKIPLNSLQVSGIAFSTPGRIWRLHRCNRLNDIDYKGAAEKELYRVHLKWEHVHGRYMSVNPG